MSQLFNHRGIASRVIPTQGSRDNVSLLATNLQPTIAISQYDVALWAQTGNTNFVYHSGLPSELDQRNVPYMRRLATLHKENLHIISKPIRSQGTDHTKWESERLLSSSNWNQLTFCVGPRISGKRVVAESVISHSKFQPLTKTFLSVELMVERIIDGSVDVGFYMGNVPSPNLNVLLADPDARLISIETAVIAKLAGQVFEQETIDKVSSYSKRPVGNTNRTASLDRLPSSSVVTAPVDTISTHALLVTKADIPNIDVRKLTKIIFDGADDLELNRTNMAKNLPYIPLHEDAIEHYRDEEYPGFTRRPSPLERLSDFWWSIFGSIESRLVEWEIDPGAAHLLARGLSIVLVILIAVLINFVTKNFILTDLTLLIDKAETKWEALFVDRKILNLLSYLAAALVIYVLARFAVERHAGESRIETLITNAALIYIIAIGSLVLKSLLSGALAAR